MPPKPAPKNTSNREYYHTSEDIDAPDHDDHSTRSTSPSPPGKTSNTQATAQMPEKKVFTQSTESLVEVKEEEEEETPSPTPSDIIVRADFEDVGAMTSLNAMLEMEGKDAEERKKRLIDFQLKRNVGRMMAKRKELEMSKKINKK